MHRHRRCTQIIQEFTSLHGYETPESGDAAGLAEAGILSEYHAAIQRAHAASAEIAASAAPEAGQSALYLLPLATRIRSLFKMDFAEAQYISELRSAPAGHFSYRKVALGDVISHSRTSIHSYGSISPGKPISQSPSTSFSKR